MQKHDFGMIGLAVMGRNLALNIADHGYHVSGYNRSYDVTKQMVETSPHANFTPYETLEDFVDSLEKPRKIMLMVKAGAPVDQVLQSLTPLLDKGDMIFDGGNSFFQDTIRRNKELSDKGLYYFGVGVSGGEEGARNGPSIMPGGDQSAYKHVRALFENISAKADDGTPCCTYIGENGAGHYVKMVHNGIEYADMQIISEAYLLMKYVGGFTNAEIAQAFTSFASGRLNSFLITITANIFGEKDEDGQADLIDKIIDISAQKGTGKWTSMEAANLGVDVSMISAAYNARVLSGTKSRELIRKSYPIQNIQTTMDKKAFVNSIEAGMYTAKIVAYAQGFDLLQHAAQEYNWNLDFQNIARIFRAGCIIQADFLNEIMKAYAQEPSLSHLLLSDFFKDHVLAGNESLRSLVIQAIENAIPVPAFSNAINYIAYLRSNHVGANLIQAQRDYFGAHTFERNDTPGYVHHEWGNRHE